MEDDGILELDFVNQLIPKEWYKCNMRLKCVWAPVISLVIPLATPYIMALISPLNLQYNEFLQYVDPHLFYSSCYSLWSYRGHESLEEKNSRAMNESLWYTKCILMNHCVTKWIMRKLPGFMVWINLFCKALILQMMCCSLRSKCKHSQ